MNDKLVDSVMNDRIKTRTFSAWYSFTRTPACRSRTRETATEAARVYGGGRSCIRHALVDPFILTIITL